ncbi:CHC2 zinc finger domain-containing protein [Kutzneria chonburiensis]|uniref:CHC2 zinc finger domain-containing protein n=1 Tax=Kutzneria chonburiensis TaxID=1483604 RepID=UPI003B640128
MHGEEHASASISFSRNAFRCHGCGSKGDVLSIIRQQEGGDHSSAVRRAEEISGGRYEPVPRRTDGKPRRRVFGQPGTGSAERPGDRRPLPPWLRS